MSDDPKHLRHATLDWTGNLVFSGGAPGGPTVTIDGDGGLGPSPVIALLLAAGACAGADVVSILEKMQVTLASCRIELTGRRNPDYPRRYNHVWLRFHLRGEGLTEANARRAVELSVTRYCSVLLTLDPAMPVETEIIIDG
jgi:putative redox protein